MSETRLIQTTFDSTKIPVEKYAYFRDRLRGRIYELLIEEYLAAKEHGASKKKLAQRMGRRPEQITRILSAPGNLTLDTISDFILAVSDGELGISVERFSDQAPRNSGCSDWLLSSNYITPQFATTDTKVVVSNSPATITAPAGGTFKVS